MNFDHSASSGSPPSRSERSREIRSFPPRPGLSAAALKYIALALMLGDHLWATLIPGNEWITFLGRLAFPIFAFQIAEGYAHTSNFRRYALRLLAFALVSEVPFDLLYASTPFYPFHQNVMFTLLLGLLGLRCLDGVQKGTTKQRALYFLGLLGVLLGSVLLFADYGWQGVGTVLLFGLTRNRRWAKPVQVIGLFLLFQVFFQGRYLDFTVLGYTGEWQAQAFGLFALPLLWCYHGRQGGGGRALQWGAYAFYPLHMLILWLIFTLR